MSTYNSIASAYSCLLGRSLSQSELSALSDRQRCNSDLVISWEALSSAEFARRCLDNVLPLHLHLINAARIKLVSTMLPPAARIVDLGGANGNLHQMGYPYPFEELIAVDLPPQDRCELYRGIKMEACKTAKGTINVLYTNMTDLSAIPTAYMDLVWMGQAIEHISEQDSLLVYREVQRILRRGGHFCLDTPNRNLTEIHTTGWIHPEHKIEYKPEHLQQNLVSAGFRIESQFGLCEMVRTWRNKSFDYTDFFVGGGISTNLPACYIQYYHCRW